MSSSYYSCNILYFFIVLVKMMSTIHTVADKWVHLVYMIKIDIIRNSL